MQFIYGATTITVYGHLYPLENIFKRRQNILETENGTVDVYDRGGEQKLCVIQLADDHDNHDVIREFFIDVVNFREKLFTIVPDSDVPIANIEDTSITTARFWDWNFNARIEAHEHYIWKIIIRIE